MADNSVFKIQVENEAQDDVFDIEIPIPPIEGQFDVALPVGSPMASPTSMETANTGSGPYAAENQPNMKVAIPDHPGEPSSASPAESPLTSPQHTLSVQLAGSGSPVRAGSPLDMSSSGSPSGRKGKPQMLHFGQNQLSPVSGNLLNNTTSLAGSGDTGLSISTRAKVTAASTKDIQSSRGTDVMENSLGSARGLSRSASPHGSSLKIVEDSPFLHQPLRPIRELSVSQSRSESGSPRAGASLRDRSILDEESDSGESDWSFHDDQPIEGPSDVQQPEVSKISLKVFLRLLLLSSIFFYTIIAITSMVVGNLAVKDAYSSVETALGECMGDETAMLDSVALSTGTAYLDGLDTILQTITVDTAMKTPLLLVDELAKNINATEGASKSAMDQRWTPLLLNLAATVTASRGFSFSTTIDGSTLLHAAIVYDDGCTAQSTDPSYANPSCLFVRIRSGGANGWYQLSSYQAQTASASPPASVVAKENTLYEAMIRNFPEVVAPFDVSKTPRLLTNFSGGGDAITVATAKLNSGLPLAAASLIPRAELLSKCFSSSSTDVMATLVRSIALDGSILMVGVVDEESGASIDPRLSSSKVSDINILSHRSIKMANGTQSGPSALFPATGAGYMESRMLSVELFGVRAATNLMLLHAVDNQFVGQERSDALSAAKDSTDELTLNAIIATCILSALLFIVGIGLCYHVWDSTGSITHGVIVLTENLRSVFTMDLEDAVLFTYDPENSVVPIESGKPAQQIAGFSELRELHEAQEASNRMIDSLKNYRKYLPDTLFPNHARDAEDLAPELIQAIETIEVTKPEVEERTSPHVREDGKQQIFDLPEVIDPAEEDGETPQLHSANQSVSILRQHKSRSDMKMSVISRPEFNLQSVGQSLTVRPEPEHSKGGGLRERMGSSIFGTSVAGGFGLKKHRVTVLAATFVGFLRMSQESIGEAHAISQTFLQIVLAVIDRNGGIVLHMSADRVVATWNAFKSEPGHEAKGAICAHEISRTIQAADEEFLLPDLQLAVAVTSGMCAAGYSGTFTERSSVAQGPPLRLAEELLSLFVGINVRVGVTRHVKEHCPGALWTLPIDVIAESDTVRTEIYELRSGEIPNCYMPYCDGFSRFVDCDYDIAKELFAEAVRKSMPKMEPHALRMLKLSMLFADLPMEYVRAIPSWQRFEADVETNQADSPSNKRKYKSEKRKSAMADDALRMELLNLRKGPAQTPVATRNGLLDASPTGGEFFQKPDESPRMKKMNSSSSPPNLQLPGAPPLPRPPPSARNEDSPITTATNTTASKVPSSESTITAGNGTPLLPSSKPSSPMSTFNAEDPTPLDKKSSSNLMRKSQPWLQRNSQSQSVGSMHSISTNSTGSPPGLGTQATSAFNQSQSAAFEPTKPMLNVSTDSQVQMKQNVIEFKDRKDMVFRMSDHILGRGAVGEVLMGMTEAGALVAIKSVPLPAPPANDQPAAQMNPIQRRRMMRKGLNVSSGADLNKDADVLLNEVAVLSRLRHENIVGYLSSSIVDRRLLVVMEFISGGSLYSMLSEFKAVPVATAKRYLRDTLRGLSFLHSEDIVHRDIKPHNVLLLIDGSCKLTDFGTSTHMNKIAGINNMEGTPQYMAPEACKGKAEKASDIWSFGIMMAQLLTGDLPWADEEGGFVPLRFLYKLGNDDSMVPVISPELPSDAQEILEKCFQRDPTKRPSAAELLQVPFFSQTAVATPLRSNRRGRSPGNERRSLGTSFQSNHSRGSNGGTANNGGSSTKSTKRNGRLSVSRADFKNFTAFSFSEGEDESPSPSMDMSGEAPPHQSQTGSAAPSTDAGGDSHTELLVQLPSDSGPFGKPPTPRRQSVVTIEEPESSK